MMVMALGCSTYRGMGGLKGSRPPPPPTATTDSREAGPLVLAWPLAHNHLNRGFNPGGGKGKLRKAHLGVDLAGTKGTPIYAAHRGLVIFSGVRYHGFGKLVMLEFSEQWATIYAHLDSFKVREGDWVERGQVLGLMGRTGHATGVHLHFELLHNKVPIDPLLYLPTPR
jgi:murein DD-endopeptidase MepM/ murein hydrolase activator NlpD